MSNVTTNKRWLFWLPMLALAAWLAFFGDKSPTEQGAFVKPRTDVSSNRVATSQPFSNVGTTPTQVVQSVGANKASSEAVSLEALIPRSQLISMPNSESRPGRDLFAGRSWTPPPLPVKALPPAAPALPAAQVAPPLPFTYVGKKLEADVWEVFLQRGEQSFLVRTGATIEGTYRVDSITPQRLNMTYLPLGQSQSLSIGESQ